MAISRISGDRFMYVSGVTAAQYPSDGQGGITATAASSELAGAPEVVITKIMILAADVAAATTLTLKDSGGTTIGAAINVAIMAATAVPVVYDFGPTGMRVPVVSGSANFSVTPSDADIKVLVFYRRVRRGG